METQFELRSGLLNIKESSTSGPTPTRGKRREFGVTRTSELHRLPEEESPKRDWIEAEAIIAGEGEAKPAFSLLKTKYGIPSRLVQFDHWLQSRKDTSVALRIRI